MIIPLFISDKPFIWRKVQVASKPGLLDKLRLQRTYAPGALYLGLSDPSSVIFRKCG
jgi:hypothetical protein